MGWIRKKTTTKALRDLSSPPEFLQHAWATGREGWASLAVKGLGCFWRGVKLGQMGGTPGLGCSWDEAMAKLVMKFCLYFRHERAWSQMLGTWWGGLDEGSWLQGDVLAAIWGVLDATRRFLTQRGEGQRVPDGSCNVSWGGILPGHQVQAWSSFWRPLGSTLWRVPDYVGDSWVCEFITQGVLETWIGVGSTWGR